MTITLAKKLMIFRERFNDNVIKRRTKVIKFENKEHGTQIECIFYTFAYMTGARLSELLATKWEEINFSTATWNLKTSLHLDKELGYYPHLINQH